MDKLIEGLFNAPVGVLLIVLGFILILLGLIGKLYIWFALERPLRIAAAIGGGVLFILGIAFTVGAASSPKSSLIVMVTPSATLASTPIPTPPSVTIVSPAEGSKVPGTVIVRGTAHDIPQNEELWLFIVPEGTTGYFPQPGPIKVLSDGTWSVTVYIGQQEGSADVGKKFVLIPALVDQNDREAKDAIQVYFNQPGPVYKGIEPLPSGIQLMSPISVIRT